MATKTKFLVEIIDQEDGSKSVHVRTVSAPSKSTAVRQVIRSLLASGDIKKAPRSLDGWWENVKCTVL